MLKTVAYALTVALVVAPVALAQSTQVPAEVKAGAYVLDPSHSKITWSVSHLGFSTYVGQFTGVAGTLKLDPKAVQAADLQVTVDTASVGTLNTALDNHLKSPDFLDVAKFPTATFKATSVKTTGERTADISGDLTLHGVTKPVVIEATFNRAGIAPTDGKYTVGFSGKAVLKRSDFGIKTYLPVLGDEVTLQLAAEFKPAP
ncbi:MAG: polyisoprenoid-binding protein [Phenylobacterium sp.]|uniref:YceI family protein n=1 Tax=Phenylobacterium sp. TaxID=1871053 RepID=UPI0012196988|nr:YceI family protein [Phenylobacterium sp.]TAL33817.1 MAG: polyisoprenoid-binding protein [Phenylobacterium sp.]